MLFKTVVLIFNFSEKFYNSFSVTKYTVFTKKYQLTTVLPFDF